jgi:hypothetical protein
MKVKLEQHPDIPTFDATKDPIALLTQARKIVCRHEAHMQNAQPLRAHQVHAFGVAARGKTNKESMECFHGM